MTKDAACLEFECEVDFGCKMHPNCTQFCRFIGAKTPRKSFGMYGGDDGARTRDLCRDRAAL